MTKKPELSYIPPKIDLPIKKKKQVEIHYHFSENQNDKNRKDFVKDIIICISLLLTGFFLGAMF
jgi:hypothetical protein